MTTFSIDDCRPLPVSWKECLKRGWTDIDILLVTGDAYIDHPSFGIALIGRVLEASGYRVAILPQPHYHNSDDFKKFPTPNLFCGISAGNLDSIVANYSGNGKIRNSDAYSPGGNPWRGSKRGKTERRRPDRACLIYTNLARSAYPGVPIVLGGIEASLRRFVHYDYQQHRLRASFLTDAKADLLVYGMGEKSIREIAWRCENQQNLSSIAGSCQRLTDKELHAHFPDIPKNSSRKFLILPSHQEISENKKLFLDAEIEINKHAKAYSNRIILQRQQSHWLVQYPAQTPLKPDELDILYHYPYSRKPHPTAREIPAYTMIKDSITIVRGCSGNCSFCAITNHQGPAIVSRSRKSIRQECEQVSRTKDFSGTISDLGGPTANLYGTRCKIGSCKKHDCLYPKICTNLILDEALFLKLLEDVSNIKNIKHLFISSGLRMELLLRTPKLLRALIRKHIPGSMKIAPEHTDDELLELMHKEPHTLLKTFIADCKKISRDIGQKITFTPYIITSHPGSTEAHAQTLVSDINKLGLQVRKFQDFTPTPGTLSTAMYVTGISAYSKKQIPIPCNQADRNRQRRIVEQSFHTRQKKRKNR